MEEFTSNLTLKVVFNNVGFLYRPDVAYTIFVVSSIYFIFIRLESVFIELRKVFFKSISLYFMVQVHCLK